MTAAGRVTLRRRSLRCHDRGLTAHPLDARLGVESLLSPHVTRLACLAAATWSFDVASGRLHAFAGVPIDGETIRRHSHRAAQALTRRREQEPPKASFEDAAGEVEFLTDGVMAPTRGGWRELKMALYLKRPLGEPAEPEDWAQRELPRPTAQAASATVADSETFAARCAPLAQALRIEPAGSLTAPGNGAEWIWNTASTRFPATTHAPAPPSILRALGLGLEDVLLFVRNHRLFLDCDRLRWFLINRNWD